MDEFIITIEEHISKDIRVKADDMEKAMEIVKEKYKNGEFVLDGDSSLHTKLMSGYDVNADIYTDFIEF